MTTVVFRKCCVERPIQPVADTTIQYPCVFKLCGQGQSTSMATYTFPACVGVAIGGSSGRILAAAYSTSLPLDFWALRTSVQIGV
jgi:hypothetical protein